MRIIAYLIFLLMTFPVKSQTELDIVISWQDTSGVDCRATFEDARYDETELPLYQISFLKERKFDIEAEIIVHEIFSKTWNCHQWDPSSTFKIETSAVKTGFDFLHQITITPVRENFDQLEFITSFTLRYVLSPADVEDPEDDIFKENSVLRDGEIYKMAIKKSGIYRLSRGDLEALGLSNFFISDIQLYGNYGGLLPEENIATDLIDDLMPIPMEIVDNNANGIIDGQDRVYFYAEGASKFIIDQEGELSKPINIYSDEIFIFLKYRSGQDQKFLENKSSAGTADYQTSSYTYYKKSEEDIYNLLAENPSTSGSGKKWFGELITPDKPTVFEEVIDKSLIPGTPYSVTIPVASRSNGTSQWTLKSGDESAQLSLGTVNLAGAHSIVAKEGTLKLSATATGDKPKVEINLTQGGSILRGWIDYIEIIGRAEFNVPEEQYLFFDLHAMDKNAEFSLPQGEYDIWNVTNMLSSYRIEPRIENSRFKFNEPQGKVQTYIAYDKNSVTPPQLHGEIPNQNLHAIQAADLLIVHPQEFKEAADHLAEHRSSITALEAITVDISQVANEFGRGIKDPAALRNFFRLLYLRDPFFNYALLFGDGSYDHRHIYTEFKDENFIPVFSSKSYLHPISSFPSDDFYSMMDTEDDPTNLTGGLDVTVSRLPVRSAYQAENIVDKIITYDLSPQRLDDWKLDITMIADDEDGNDFVRQNEKITDFLEEDYPEFNIRKLYLDAFEQVNTSGGQRYPLVRENINNRIEQGNLVFSYIGHGGPNGLSQERVLQISDILNWDNPLKLPVFITATCSFTGYDKAGSITAGEHMITSNRGGCVALFSTVRAVYSNSNAALMTRIYREIFKRDDEGRPRRFGDIMLSAKNAMSASNQDVRRFSLFADPAQRLALPDYEIVLDSINHQSVFEPADTVGALQPVFLQGHIEDYQGNVKAEFQGNVEISIYDKPLVKTTLGQDPGSYQQEYKEQINILAKSKAEVVNGSFSTLCYLPKDIDYSIGSGKIVMYAENGDDKDAAGASRHVYIGATGDDIAKDDNPPVIKLWMDDTTFVNGDAVQPSSTLIAHLSDDYGINLSSLSLGHEIKAKLNGPMYGSYKLTDYFEPNLNSYNSGTIHYIFDDLPPGEYTLELTAFDIANNPAKAEIYFTVVDPFDEGVTNLTAYPNPFISQTTLIFDEFFGKKVGYINISIYDVMGRAVDRIEVERDEVSEPIIWNGRDESGAKVPAGIYYYNVELFINENDGGTTVVRGDNGALIKI